VTYAIRFEFLDPGWGDRGPTVCYAGWTAADPPSLGIAMTSATAATWDDREVAERWLANGYGEEMRKNGKVVELNPTEHVWADDEGALYDERTGQRLDGSGEAVLAGGTPESPDGPEAREEVDCGPSD
jgi:hypothetical protein